MHFVVHVRKDSAPLCVDIVTRVHFFEKKQRICWYTILCFLDGVGSFFRFKTVHHYSCAIFLKHYNFDDVFWTLFFHNSFYLFSSYCANVIVIFVLLPKVRLVNVIFEFLH